jgi:hypothetical protein
VFAALKGRVAVPLGLFDSKECRHLAQQCKKHGLIVEAEAVDQSGYMLFNEQTNVCLVIEDDLLAKQVCEEALAHGVPVKHIEG